MKFSQAPPEEIRARFAQLQGFLVDLDGTTYVGNSVIPGAPQFFQAVRKLGKRYLFFTNNSSESAHTYLEKLCHLGIDAQGGDVLTSGDATAMYLASADYTKLFVLGTPSFENELKKLGFLLTPEDPDCVVLGFDKTLSYRKLEIATLLIRKGVPFIATHPDKVCPTEYGYIPDCGAMAALLSTATDVDPLVIGKPQPLMAQMALKRLHLEAKYVAIIGDRLYTDIRMGCDAGLMTVLVLSGETTPELLQQADEISPDLVVESLAALTEYL
jgi:HAD superfamily hydrolase (TIGR01457 family)